MTSRADTFNRTDSALTINSPSDSAGDYTVVGGWGVISNTGYCVVTTAGDPANVAVLEASSAVVDVETMNTADPAITPWKSALIARYLDVSNHLYMYFSGANYIQLYKVVAGVSTELGSTYFGTLAVTDVLILSVDVSNNILCKQNGNTRVSATDSAHSSRTKHGLGVTYYGTATDRFNYLTITDNGGGGGGGLPIPVAMVYYRQLRA